MIICAHGKWHAIEIPFGPLPDPDDNSFNIDFDFAASSRRPEGLRGSLLSTIELNPEQVEDIRRWGRDEIDEPTRRAIMAAGNEGPMPRIIGGTPESMRRLASAEF